MKKRSRNATAFVVGELRLEIGRSSQSALWRNAMYMCVMALKRVHVRDGAVPRTQMQPARAIAVQYNIGRNGLH